MKIFKNKPIYLLIGLFLVLVFLSSASFWLWQDLFSFSGEKISGSKTEAVTSTLSRRWIDGKWIEPTAASSSVFGAMIDNHPEARPPAGLDSAVLVWEAPVEGGLSRFLAIWPTTAAVEKIGPIRSARPYFLDWIKEVNGLYLHVGGSDQALNGLKIKEVADLNEYYRGWYFWRDKSRPKPHHIFTSSTLVSKALSDSPRLFSQISGGASSWPYQEEPELARRGFIDPTPIDYGVSKVNWRYDRDKNIYERLSDEGPYLTAFGAPIMTKNLIYLYTSIKIIDEIGRKEIRTTGSGQAVIMRDGQVISGEWRKASINERTRFFDKDGGQELKLNAGLTWIEVLGQALGN